MEKLEHPVSVLLVEDNVLNQKLIFLNLSKYGFKIDIANHGREALDKLESGHYDLILMDLMMPIMDGLETTVAIREKEKDTKQHMPIVGLTANTYDADREKCLSYGMDEYMAKPFDLQEFFNNLKKLNII
ncbi:response regulator [Carboxylicivirga sp. A043]|uniref:response regulator n=1 Tax=Carboxylicivirga litoralis TaxID=2816963 RepID=UPI0021CB8FAB|nr:response regulator [Carboxylicivirga sp. A043]MCU4156611.1 response regulator [Carboxylicivirga sp. A043]